jgi:hypothetical protein
VTDYVWTIVEQFPDRDRHSLEAHRLVRGNGIRSRAQLAIEIRDWGKRRTACYEDDFSREVRDVLFGIEGDACPAEKTEEHL